MAFLRRRKKRKTAAETPPAREAGGHASVLAPDPYAFRASHRRLAWLCRMSVGMNVCLTVCIVVLVHAIGALVPLKSTQIALVRTYAPEDRLYRVEPIGENVEGFDLLLESMARRFVRLSLEIDPVTQPERMREVSHLVEPAFGERFRRERLARLDDAMESGLEREVLVEAANRIESFGDEYKMVVDFTQVDRRDGKEIERKPLRAWLSIATRPALVREEERFTNPMGFTVMNMTLKSRSRVE